MSMFASLLAGLFLFAIQGLLLQTAVALTGDPAPRAGRAFVTAALAALLASMGAAGWGCTFGLVVSVFSKTLASLMSVFVAVSITAAVYRSRLWLTGGHALVVAALHHLMAWATAALLWGLIRLWPL